MDGRGKRLFRDGAALVLFSKYAWFRRQGYDHPEAARKARWRAGLTPAEGSSNAPRTAFVVLHPVEPNLARTR